MGLTQEAHMNLVSETLIRIQTFVYGYVSQEGKDWTLGYECSIQTCLLHHEFSVYFSMGMKGCFNGHVLPWVKYR